MKWNTWEDRKAIARPESLPSYGALRTAPPYRVFGLDASGGPGADDPRQFGPDLYQSAAVSFALFYENPGHFRISLKL